MGGRECAFWLASYACSAIYACSAVVAGMLAVPAHAQDTIKIAYIDPLSGAVRSVAKWG